MLAMEHQIAKLSLGWQSRSATTNIHYIKGSENIVADNLSRITEVSTSVIAYDSIARVQGNDEKL